MGRLIDADVLIKAIQQRMVKINSLFEEEKTVVEIIDAQPTAYDIEKVVAELEEHRADFQCKFCKHFYDGKDECSLDCTDALIDNLIDIVRKGGIDD